MVFLLLLCLAMSAQAAMERVARIVDSRTIVVIRNGAEADVRLSGVIVPPAEEAAARQYLRTELLARWVLIDPDRGLGAPYAFVYRSPDALFVNGAVAQRAWTGGRTPMTVLGDIDLGVRVDPQPRLEQPRVSGSASTPAPRTNRSSRRRSAGRRSRG